MKKWFYVLLIPIMLGACSSGDNGADTLVDNTDTTMTWNQDDWNNKNWE